MSAKYMRMRHFIKSNGSLIVAADHGFSTPEIYKMWNMDNYFEIISNFADGIIIHKGIAECLLPKISSTSLSLIVHATGASQYTLNHYKIPVCTVNEAISMGADAISVHVNFATKHEQKMLSHLAEISREAKRMALPLICMCYFPTITEPKLSDLKHASRICQELGVDIIKIEISDRQEVLNFISDFSLPIYIAGGNYIENEKNSLEHFKQLKNMGFKNFIVGRNIFMSTHPEKILLELRAGSV